MSKSKSIKRVCFDIETELFDDSFRFAKDLETRLKHIPKMRVACVFDESVWKYFLPSEAQQLIQLLLDADEVISFNGKVFDELVLRKHHGMNKKMPKKGKHIDLLEEVAKGGKRWISLDNLAKENLGEGKHTGGRNMADLDIEALKVACHSDVWQTYRLWKLWKIGKLQIPERKLNFRSRWQNVDGSLDVGPGHHMPDFCPHCHSINTLTLLDEDEDEDEMSEGQTSDYEAGLWGTVYCEACEQTSDFG